MAKYKAEYLYQHHRLKGVSFRSRLIGMYTIMNRLGSIFPSFFNLIARGWLTSPMVKKLAGFAPQRSLPALSRTSLRKWAKGQSVMFHCEKDSMPEKARPSGTLRKVWLFCDEFTNYHESLVGIRTILLLNRLGYKVCLPEHAQSGRALISKGLLEKARKVADRNVAALAPLAGEESPVIGIEPSAILGFRDEYPALVSPQWREAAHGLAPNCLTVEEFLCREFDRGRIDPGLFSVKPVNILVHGHCHQKALSSVDFSLRALSIPKNAVVKPIDCGCCGMAGSFGFEKEHYAMSMEIGELKLFPTIRRAGDSTLIAAPGTSCRQQILDGTGRKAHHPAEILFLLLNDSGVE